MSLVREPPYRERCSPELRDSLDLRQVTALCERIADLEQENRELLEHATRLRTVADDARELAKQPCGRCGS